MSTTIYTYLYNDDLNGSRMVYMDDCMCKLYDIKRDDSDFLKDFKEELKKPALYILLNKESRKAYIGETDDFIKRVNQHIVKKGFWNEAVVFLGSNNDTLSKTEVQYLEYLAYNKANVSKSYNLDENSQPPKKPNMSVIQKSKTDKFFGYVTFLSKFIGCDIFEQKIHLEKVQQSFISPIITPESIAYTKEDLGGKITMSLNGNGPFSKREMALNIIKEFVKTFPDATFEMLNATFPQNYLGRFSQYELLTSDIEKARNWKKLGEDHVHYFIDEKDILTSSDGVRFAVCVEWDRNNLISLLGIAQALKWKFKINKK